MQLPNLSTQFFFIAVKCFPCILKNRCTLKNMEVVIADLQLYFYYLFKCQTELMALIISKTLTWNKSSDQETWLYRPHTCSVTPKVLKSKDHHNYQATSRKRRKSTMTHSVFPSMQVSLKKYIYPNRLLLCNVSPKWKTPIALTK